MQAGCFDFERDLTELNLFGGGYLTALPPSLHLSADPLTIDLAAALNPIKFGLHNFEKWAMKGQNSEYTCAEILLGLIMQRVKMLMYFYRDRIKK